MEDKSLPEVIQAKDIAVVQPSPMEMVQAFSAANMDIAMIKEMIEIQRDHDAYQAKKAYTKAMAAFKENPPTIMKDKKVGFASKKPGVAKTSYSHASLGNVAKQIGAAMGSHGLSAAWPLEQNEKGIKVTCTITHELGHSESTALFACSDNTGNKNSIQAVGSTISYLQRYTLLALTGLATEDQDDDGVSSEPEKMISEKQVSEITDMINDKWESEADRTGFMEWANIKSVETILAKNYSSVKSAIKASK